MATGKKSMISPFWAIVIMLLIVVGAVFFFTDIVRQDPAPEREPQVPSTEWTTAPEGGVEIDLPDTPVRVVPDEETTSEDAQQREDR
jgi:hypothetical protein